MSEEASKEAARLNKARHLPVCTQPYLLVSHAPDHPATAEITALREETTRAVEQDDLAIAAERFVDYWLGPGTWEMQPQARRMPLMEGMRKVAAEWHAAGSSSEFLLRVGEGR